MCFEEIGPKTGSALPRRNGTSSRFSMKSTDRPLSMWVAHTVTASITPREMLRCISFQKMLRRRKWTNGVVSSTPLKGKALTPPSLPPMARSRPIRLVAVKNPVLIRNPTRAWASVR